MFLVDAAEQKQKGGEHVAAVWLERDVVTVSSLSIFGHYFRKWWNWIWT